MAPENEPPKIPSFKPLAKSEEEKKGGGMAAMGKTASPPATSTGFKFPGMAQSQGTGGLKVRGLPGGATVIERLKRLRKKDLAFIAAGLSVLMMAPVAEHFLMSPEQEAGVLQQGFSTPGDNSLFPDGRTVYESGTGGLSPGALYGQGSDVITPLNVRDPSALVMGPGATQKPSATVTAPEPPKEQPGGGGWKDALAQAATAGTKTAVQKAPKLPMPNVKMSGALRGIGVAQGGGGGSLSLAPLSASNVPNRAKDSNSLSRVSAAPGYRGAARQSKESGGGLESLKAAADRQGDIFNKGHSAANSLDTAAREAIPSGGGGGSSEGNPSQGDAYKYPGGNGDHDKRNISVGESLELMRQKLEMQKAIDLKWKKKEWNEFGRKQEIEKMFIQAGGKLFEKAFIEPVGNIFSSAIGSVLSPPGAEMVYKCTSSGMAIPKSKAGSVLNAPSGDSTLIMKDGNVPVVCANGQWWLTAGSASSGGAPSPGGGTSTDNSPQTVINVGGASNVTQGAASTGQGWSGEVTALKQAATELKGKIDGIQTNGDKDLEKLKTLGSTGFDKINGALGNHDAAVGKFNIAVGKFGEVNQQLGSIQKTQGERIKEEQEVAELSKKALDAYQLTGEKDGPSFGRDKASTLVADMTKKATNVDGYKDSSFEQAQASLNAGKQAWDDSTAFVGRAQKVPDDLRGPKGEITEANAIFRGLNQNIVNGSLSTGDFLEQATKALDKTNGTANGNLAKTVPDSVAKASLWTKYADNGEMGGGAEVPLDGKAVKLPSAQALTNSTGNDSTAYATKRLDPLVSTVQANYKAWKSCSGEDCPAKKTAFDQSLQEAQKAKATAVETWTKADEGLKTVKSVYDTAVKTLNGEPGTQPGGSAGPRVARRGR